ncbi:Uu.00g102040.m01.CDS01 [Anthostomella pinea]|uniref:Uu.00g102040.m01.CDS01 n=1 Tax=Anthostomella pinea TaxID=933095 RepID=A0AAI8VD54_9PEZI|nr:Uu.00g102040.m01.CDS01 [Anthostomella pinea]
MSSISTPPAGKCEWLVVVPDKPGMQQKRLDVRPKHFEGLQPYLESGQFKTGGAVLNEKPEGDDPTKWDFHGSTLVLIAESKDEVKAILEKDIYATSGVWDVENAQIWAAKFAFRKP